MVTLPDNTPLLLKEFYDFFETLSEFFFFFKVTFYYKDFLKSRFVQDLLIFSKTIFISNAVGFIDR